MGPISLRNKRNSESRSEYKKGKVNSKAGNQIHISRDGMPTDEMEVTHEVFFGENLKRVIRVLFGK